jgi:hypothetical protein
MNSQEAIKISLDTASFVSLGYLGDLTDQELLHRPCVGCNHINWQLGHIIAAENDMINKVSPGSMPALPEGFAAKYTSETSGNDDPQTLATKDELLKLAAEQRAGTLAALAKVSDAGLDQPTGVEYAPTVAAMFAMQGCHWLMHAGQWAVVRRQLGRKPMF